MRDHAGAGGLVEQVLAHAHAVFLGAHVYLVAALPVVEPYDELAPALVAFEYPYQVLAELFVQVCRVHENLEAFDIVFADEPEGGYRLEAERVGSLLPGLCLFGGNPVPRLDLPFDKDLRVQLHIGLESLVVLAEQGEFATTGRPLFKIADTRRMYIRAYITSEQLAEVRTGQKAEVTCDYGNGKGMTYDGTVTWIAQKSEFTPKTVLTDDERASLVYAVKIAIDNDGGAKIGMYGKVRFLK